MMYEYCVLILIMIMVLYDTYYYRGDINEEEDDD